MCAWLPCIRCTMVTRPQPDLTEDRDIFRTLARHHGGHFGAWTAVTTGGTVNVGDEVCDEPIVSETSDEPGAVSVAAQSSDRGVR